jgi:integrase
MVFKRGTTYWYAFRFEGRRIQESAKTPNKQLAQEAEINRRRELRDGLMGVDSRRKERARAIKDIGKEYATEYAATHASSGFVTHSVRHLTEHLGDKMVAQIDARLIRDYQMKRLREGASGRTANVEVDILLRMIGTPGTLLRVELKSKKMLKVAENTDAGKKFEVIEQDKLLKAAKESRSPHIDFALQLALNGGMRDKEIRTLRWSQIDFVKHVLTVGKSKNEGSTGRIVPLNGEILPAFVKHRAWYIKTFMELKPDWYVFPFGPRGYMDPKKHVTTLKTAWTTARRKTGVKGRWHDTRHTVVSQLQENAGRTHAHTRRRRTPTP